MGLEEIGADEQVDLEGEQVQSQIDVYTREDGSRVCSRCGRALADGDFLVSMMGHGLFCKNGVECVDKAVEILGDDSTDMDVKCERCRQGLRGRGFRIMSRGTLLVCANAEDCGARVISLVEGG